jgi:hypothetical protein
MQCSLQYLGLPRAHEDIVLVFGYFVRGNKPT